ALFSAAAQALFLLGLLLVQARGSVFAVLRDRRFWGAVLAGVIVVVGYLPWVPSFLKQRSQVQTVYWSRPVELWGVPNVCYQMVVDPETVRFLPQEALAISALAVVILLALLWRARAGEWYVFTAAVVPFALSILVSFCDTKVFHLRYFLFANLFLLAAVAV